MSLRASLAGSCPENITPHGLVAAVVLSDEIDAGRSGRLQKIYIGQKLTMLERANQTAEWVGLTEEKQKQQPAAQVEPWQKSPIRRPHHSPPEASTQRFES